MGFFDKLFGGGPAVASARKPVGTDPFDGPPPPWRTAGPGAHGFVNVAGESHYQETLTQLASLFDLIGRTARNFAVTLTPEPQNTYGSKAVAVQTDSGSTIGYLPSDIARRYQPLITAQPSRVRTIGDIRGFPTLTRAPYTTLGP